MHQLAVSMPREYAAAAQLVAVMDGLPLALDQAGSYIEETGCRPTDYLQRYEQQQVRLLDRRGGPASDHPQSVTATFALALERVEREQHVAADVLRVCALLHAEAIPEEVSVEGAAYLGPSLEPLAADPSKFDQAIAVLRRLSLVQRHTETRTLSIHRLVQAVLRERMGEQEQVLWLKRVIDALNAVFPEVSFKVWKQCERLLPHMLAASNALPDQAGGQELAEVVRKAADYLYVRVQYKQVEPLYQRALRIQEQILGSEHPQMIVSLNRLANIYSDQGKYEEAEALYERALRIGEQSLAPEYPELGYPLNNLAHLFYAQGKYEQAEALYQRALRTWEQALGPEHQQAAHTLNGLGDVYTEQGKYEQAEASYQHALRTWEQTFGPEHPYVAQVLEGLANLYSRQRKYEQAEPLYQRSIHIVEQVVGAEYPDIAYPLTGLANLYAKQGQDEQAEALYQRALRIREQALGPEHLLMAHPLNGLAALYTRQRKYEQAEPLFRHALAVLEQRLGRAHPDTVRVMEYLSSLEEGIS
jgi:tetratricopeptide (TPR) repeat protein